MEPSPNKEVDLKLLSPAFRPRPGWGGQLKNWYDENGRTVLVRLLIIIAIPAVLAPIFNRVTSVPEPVPFTPERHSVRVTVDSGEGLIHAARIALYEYLALQEVPLALAPEQYVFAEDFISRRMEPYVPAPGETLEFPYEVLSAAVLKAQSLTPQERAAWLNFVQ